MDSGQRFVWIIHSRIFPSIAYTLYSCRQTVKGAQETLRKFPREKRPERNADKNTPTTSPGQKSDRSKSDKSARFIRNDPERGFGLLNSSCQIFGRPVKNVPFGKTVFYNTYNSRCNPGGGDRPNTGIKKSNSVQKQ